MTISLLFHSHLTCSHYSCNNCLSSTTTTQPLPSFPYDLPLKYTTTTDNNNNNNEYERPQRLHRHARTGAPSHPFASIMCLVTPRRQTVVRVRDVPPRPVSNYHGGGGGSVYRRTSVVPVERVSRSSYHSHSHGYLPRRSGERVVYSKTSRTYER